MSSDIKQKMPTYFLSHGGGPWPWLEGPMRDAMGVLEESLQKIPSEIGVSPKAILMVSGHWEETEFTVQTNPNPGMLYDYGGFPEHTYSIEYSSPGSPEVASRVSELLGSAGIGIRQDPNRGYDHGMYSVLFPIWPEANIPVVQLSIKRNYDPAEHIALGRVLAPLRDEGVLIIGSGFSYHNLRLMGPEAKVPSAEFDKWLNETIVDSSPDERVERLIKWESAPSARVAQPQEDHFIPMMVVVGASENDVATRTYHQDDFFGSVSASSFRFD